MIEETKQEYKGLPSDSFEDSWSSQFWIDDEGRVHLQEFGDD